MTVTAIRYLQEPHIRSWPVHFELALNGTSLLAVTCPCKNQAVWPFWCPYQDVTVHRPTNSRKPQAKIRLACENKVDMKQLFEGSTQ